MLEVFGIFLVFHYAHPRQNPSSVVDAVYRSMNGLELSKTVVFGDFNLDSYKDTRRSQFLELSDSLAELGIFHKQLELDKFTYSSSLAASCIDYVFSAEGCVKGSVLLDHSLQSSDHMALKFELAFSTSSLQLPRNNTRAYFLRKVKGMGSEHGQ